MRPILFELMQLYIYRACHIDLIYQRTPYLCIMIFLKIEMRKYSVRCVWSSKWPRAKSIIIPKWLRLIDNWWFCNLYKCKPSLLWILPFCETYWSDSILILKDIVVDWFLVGTFGFFNVTLPTRRVGKWLSYESRGASLLLKDQTQYIEST